MHWCDVSVAVLALMVVVFLISIMLTETPFIRRYLINKHFKLYNRIGKFCEILGAVIVAVLAFASVLYLILLAYALLTGMISIRG